MSKIMTLTKIISINFLITLLLLGILFLIPPISYKIYSYAGGHSTFFPSDKREGLELYANFSWTKKHFKEMVQIHATYHDFIVWRRDDFIGETININNGLRRTVIPDTMNDNLSSFWFYGGSTTWGQGVPDAFTYPSLFAQQNGVNVVNFGEMAYLARQSVAFMVNHIISNDIQDLSDTKVVFYDGVNDVHIRCKTGHDGISTSRQNQLRTLLANKHKYSFARTFSQLTDFLAALSYKVGANIGGNTDGAPIYNCASDSDRAIEVANSLVRTWEAAADIVSSRGGEFTAILQPAAYFGDAEYGYLNLTNATDIELSQQFQAVYPLVIKFAEKSNINFIDLTHVYDSCVDCYIDYCHASPQGHKKLVQQLSEKFPPNLVNAGISEGAITEWE